MHQGTGTVRSVSLGLPAAAQRSHREGGQVMDVHPYTAFTVCVDMLLADYMCLHLFECILVSDETRLGVSECKGESTTTAGLMSKSQGLL